MNSDGNRTFYEILQVDPTASAPVIQGAYRALLKNARHHPDLGGSATAAQAINEAYGVLSDPKQRREYDRRLGPLRLDATRQQATPASVPQYILICPGCRKRNLVPDERFLEQARCGACNRLLLPRGTRGQQDDPARVFRLGLFLFDKGLYDRALRELRAAVQLRPRNPTFHYWLGRCLYQKRSYEKSRSEFQAAATLQPGQFHFRFWLGQTRHHLKDFAGAMEQFVAAAKLRPKHTPTLLRLSSYYYQRREFDKAIAILTRVVQREPYRTHPHKWLGIIHLTNDDPQSALTEFQLADRLSPGNPHTTKYIDLCRQKIG